MAKSFDMILRFEFSEEGARKVQELCEISPDRDRGLDLEEIADILTDCGIVNELSNLPYDNMEVDFVPRED